MGKINRLFFVALIALSIEADFVTIYSEPEDTYCATWASAQYLTEVQNMPVVPLSGNSIRQIVHVSVGGELIRLKFSNRCGKTPLEIKEVRIADSEDQGTSEIDPDTDTKVTFGGENSIIIPAGEETYCDTFTYALNAQSEVAISIYFGEVPEQVTGHPGSRTNSYFEVGNKIKEEIFTNKNKVPHWYVIAGIEVSSRPAKRTVVCYGDSITDGRGSTDDKQDRWTDNLAFKLSEHRRTRDCGVVNMGIGATMLTSSGIERFARDVTSVKGAWYVIVLYGINDIIFEDATAETITNAYKLLIRKAHQANKFIYGGTLLPFGNSVYYTKEKDQIRNEVNDWIRKTKPDKGGFDAVFDFDEVMRDVDNHTIIDPYDDCGDGLHPSPEGYAWMLNAISDDDLELFEEEPDFDFEDYITPVELELVPGAVLKLENTIGSGVDVRVHIKGNCKGTSKGFRVWTLDEKEERTSGYFKTGAIEKEEFDFNIEFSTTGSASGIMIKGPMSTIKIDYIKITLIEVIIGRSKTVYDPIEAKIIEN